MVELKTGADHRSPPEPKIVSIRIAFRAPYQEVDYFPSFFQVLSQTPFPQKRPHLEPCRSFSSLQPIEFVSGVREVEMEYLTRCALKRIGPRLRLSFSDAVRPCRSNLKLGLVSNILPGAPLFHQSEQWRV